MAWTTPRTWTPGETVTASIMNTHVRDNLIDVDSRIDTLEANTHWGAWTILQLTSSQTLTSGAATNISWSSARENTLGAWTSGANITPPSNGYYYVAAHLRFSISGAYNNFRLYGRIITGGTGLFLGETATMNGSPQYPTVHCHGFLDLASTQTLTVQMYQVTGVNQSAYGAGSGWAACMFFMCRLGDYVYS